MVPLNCIVRNVFYKNKVIRDEADGLSSKIYKSRYIACVKNRLYGIQDCYDPEEKWTFVHFNVLDIGAAIPNVDVGLYNANRFEFMSCGFHVVDENTTMFIVFKDVSDETYHYVFYNEDSIDKWYGFVPITQAVVDTLVADVGNVFTKV